MISVFYAGLLGLLLFYITIAVIKGRRKHLVSLGPGENNEIGQLTAAHANFISYVPHFLFLFYFLERTNALSAAILHILGLAFTLGRTFHFIAFNQKMNFKLRKLGMHLTLWPLLISSVLCIYAYIKSL